MEKQYGSWDNQMYDITSAIVSFPLVLKYCADGETIEHLGEIQPKQTVRRKFGVLPGTSYLIVQSKDGTPIGDVVYLVPNKNHIYVATIAYDDNQPWDATFVNLHADMPSVRFHNYFPFDLQFRYAPGGHLGLGSSKGEVVGRVGSHQEVWFSNDWQGVNVSDRFYLEHMNGRSFAVITISSCYIRDVYIGQNISS